jgi:hypothetical protein
MNDFVRGYITLHTGLSEIVEDPRSNMALRQGLNPDDYDWLSRSLVELANVSPPRMNDGEPLDCTTLRIALRNALYRVFGSNIPEVATIYRSIEAGMSIADATDALETHIRGLVNKERDDAVSVYKRDFSRRPVQVNDKTTLFLPG